MTEFTAEEKLKSLRREIKMRERVYPRWVEQRKMTEDQARREIEIMEAIADDYESLAATERLL